MNVPRSMMDARGSAKRTRAICLPYLPLPARPSSLSHATLLTINRTRTAGPFDCVIPRSSRVPMLNHRGPSSCRSMQGSASSRPFSLFSFRLTDFLHGSLARPVCRSPTGSLIFSPHLPLLAPSVYRPASMGCGTDKVPLFSRKQGSSSFLATPTVPPSRP